ncbi:hypothetical protein KUCAC02_029637 [Chaenocephalus aceratus]|nr:hypothetical protein KUCAC02_029637 [Chaenocephalus aceratus]
MKQTAVVFEAEIGSAGSAIDLNNMSCADIMQGEKTREIKDGEKEDSGRVFSKAQAGKNRCGMSVREEGRRFCCDILFDLIKFPNNKYNSPRLYADGIKLPDEGSGCTVIL